MGLFFISALILLSVSTISVYLLIIDSFKIGIIGKRFVLAGLIVGSFGFLGASVLTHSFSGAIIRYFYLFFSYFLGLLFYLTVVAIFYAIIKFFKFKLPLLIFARSLLVLALLIFVIGLFSAYFPRVKQITLNIDNLPEYWRGKKIVQLSDFHLGDVYGPWFLNRQLNTIKEINPDLIVITGDLFDGSAHRLAELGPRLSELSAKDAVIFVPGNHDLSLGLDKIEPFLQQAGIIILRDRALTIEGLEIIGLDLHQLTSDDNPQVITNLAPYVSQSRLLLKHVPLDITWAKSMNVNLQLSGHTHHGQMFPLSIITKLIYGKYEYGLHSDGAYNIYTSSGLGSWGPPVRAFNRAEMVVITLN